MAWDVPLDRPQFDPPPATSPPDARTRQVPGVAEAAFPQAVEKWRTDTERLKTWLARERELRQTRLCPA